MKKSYCSTKTKTEVLDEEDFDFVTMSQKRYAMEKNVKETFQVKNLIDIAKVLNKGKLRYASKSRYLFIDSPLRNHEEMMNFRLYFEKLIMMSRSYGVHLKAAIVVEKVRKQKVRVSGRKQ